MHHVKEVKLLVDNLNKHRHAYYNLNTPEISDAEYDRMYDQLKKLEKENRGSSTPIPLPRQSATRRSVS